MCGGQGTTCGIWFALSPMRILELKRRHEDKNLYLLSHSKTQDSFQKKKKMILLVNVIKLNKCHICIGQV